MTERLLVTIDGSEVELVPSLEAAKKLSDKYRGMLVLIDTLNLGSLDAATDIAFWALSKKDSERDALREKVYNAGLEYLTPYFVRFVIALCNGGRVPPPTANKQVSIAEALAYA